MLREEALDIPIQVGKCINLSSDDAITLYSLMYKVLGNIREDYNE